jgi:cobalt-zinc-cadmium efflux system membrane fusion protein
VDLIAPTVNEVTRTVIVRLIIDNHNRQWKPGMFVTGHIRQSSSRTAIVLPAEAVQNIEGKNFIFVPAKYGFKPVPVVIGKRNRKRVQIIAGIKQGEVYVSRGAFYLKAIKVTSGQGSHAGHNH